MYKWAQLCAFALEYFSRKGQLGSGYTAILVLHTGGSFPQIAQMIAEFSDQ